MYVTNSGYFRHEKITSGLEILEQNYSSDGMVRIYIFFDFYSKATVRFQREILILKIIIIRFQFIQS